MTSRHHLLTRGRSGLLAEMATGRPMSRRAMLALIGGGALALPFAGPLDAAATFSTALDEGSPGAWTGNPLVRGYGIDVPFVGAGMAFVGMPRLVAAVSNAGGLGVLGASPEPPPRLALLLQQVKALTTRPFGVDLIIANGGPASNVPFTTDAHIDVCIAERVPLVVFFWATPPVSWVQRLHTSGARVWVQVGSVADALDAVSVGVDAIIAQGIEAGGHNKSTAPLTTLLDDLVPAVAPVMVLGAGGISAKSDVARAMDHGAAGVWVGTRLVASNEAYAHPVYKHAIVASDGTDTVRTTLFGPEWPHQPIRSYRNRVVKQWAGREDQVPTPPPPPAVIGTTTLFGVPYPMAKFCAVLPTPDTTGDFEEMAIALGTGAGRVDDILPAATIVKQLTRRSRLFAAGATSVR